MKTPRRPPELASLPTLPPDQLAALMAALTSSDPDRYLDWDDLRFRRPPAGFTREAWWLALKLGRAASSRAIPLNDTAGNPFMLTSTGYMHAVHHRIDALAAGKAKLPDAIANPRTRERYATASLMEEAITSSQLEGAAVTRKDAKRMLQLGRKPARHGERMIYNNYAVMRTLDDMRHHPLSESLVMDVHRLITEGTLNEPGAAGRYRLDSERIGVVDALTGEVAHLPPPAAELPGRMAAMCRFANEESESAGLHPLVRAVILHFWLAYDHPFVDGNGRTARALFYWFLLRNGYGLFEFISISKVLRRSPAKYGRAFLLTETDDNDLTYFVHFHYQVIEQAIGELTEYVALQRLEVHELEHRIGSMDQFNSRQRDLLAHALRNSDARYTFKSHQHSHGISRQTSRTDILGLVAAGWLDQRKGGREKYFVPVRDLGAKLRE